MKRDIKMVAKSIINKSSVYAVVQVAKARSKIQRVLWIVFLGIALFGCVFQLHKFLTLYFDYPVVTDLRVEQKRRIEFPAVTICNLNRMKLRHEDCLNPNISVKGCLKKKIGFRFFKNHLVVSERRLLHSCQKHLNGKYSNEEDLELHFLTMYSSMDKHKRKVIGYTAQELIQSCSINGEICSSKNFTLTQSIRYGNCYTFNKKNDKPPIYTSSTGSVSGLEITIDFGRNEYIMETHALGAKIIIHDPEDEPNFEEEGSLIGPGFEISLSLVKSQTIRLPYPYRDNCIYYKQNNQYLYANQKECVRICIQEKSMLSCGCIDPTLIHIDDWKLCNMTNMTDVCCLDKVLEDLTSEKYSCDCPPSCISSSYKVQMSYALWPSKAVFFKNFNRSSQQNLKKFQYVRKNQASLRVFYSSFVLASYVQKPKFEESEIFSHLGNELGLWLGLSLVAVFEILEVMFHAGRFLMITTTNMISKKCQ